MDSGLHIYHLHRYLKNILVLTSLLHICMCLLIKERSFELQMKLIV